MIIVFTILEIQTVVLLIFFVVVIVVVRITFTGIASTIVAIVFSLVGSVDYSSFVVCMIDFA